MTELKKRQEAENIAAEKAAEPQLNDIIAALN